MHIVVTGADGFIGTNLRVRLAELGYRDVTTVTRDVGPGELRAALSRADFVFHLAGVNRPQDEGEFLTGNAGFTESLCAMLRADGRRVPVAFASSTQAQLDNPYGRSKRAAEETLLSYAQDTEAAVYVFRLANVFGKWCRPHYNSAVATFCHLIARDRPITINNPNTPLRLIYVDDVVATFVSLLGVPPEKGGLLEAGPVYETTVGMLAQMLRDIAASRASLTTPRVGTGLMRALYATFISYLPTEAFAYEVPRHGDARGVFVEMLKTCDSGQFSYFTAHPGITRGEHYHHTKVEKFLVIRGTARFGFRNIRTDETYELVVKGGEGRIVESIPGWSHNVANIGEDELIVMLWANEVFDRSRPDTVAMKVAQ